MVSWTSAFDGAAMIAGPMRKGGQLASDPVLRRWLFGRMVGRHPAAPSFVPHRPPYLDGMLPLEPATPKPAFPFQELAPGPPPSPVHLPLPGETLRLEPGDEHALFQRAFADIETLLALHRFAWVPLLGEAADPAWVAAIWRAWAGRFSTPGEGWAWHPYTAAERAVNLLRFARSHGLPGPLRETLDILAAHGPAIASGLEYFGDRHTSNHLSNNGRGLFLLGLYLGLEDAADLGGKILVEEAARIFHPSGILSEGSSHYHCLLTRNYVECWLAAHAHGRPETGALEAIAGRALAVIPSLTLAGGMPLVGDISPDCPPPFLEGLTGDAGRGWTGLLPERDRAALAGLGQAWPRADEAGLCDAGWRSARFGPWHGLWHGAPRGWSPMPGHGHQDCGGFELHYRNEPLFVDPGRGAYGESGEAAHYRSGAVHNTLLVDSQDPYPANKPYYDEAFRDRIGGPPPGVTRFEDGIGLTHHGYGRLGHVGAVSRRWRFSGRTFTIADRVEGRARARAIKRILVTPLTVGLRDGAVTIQGETARWRVRFEGDANLRPLTHWRAYGQGVEATAIEITQTADLPWEDTLTVETL